MKRWLWLRLTRDGRDERSGAKRYRAMLDAGRPALLATAARIRACSPHSNREPNPEATGAIALGWRAERCLDCGTGVVTVPLERGAS